MKQVLVLIVLIISSKLCSQQQDSLFIDANKLYQDEKYEEALKLYEQIADNKIASDDLFYNIGNAYYKLNKVAPAIYYYEKALLLNPSHEDAKFNLGFAKRMAIDNIEPLPTTFSQKFKEGFIMKLTYNAWAWLGVILAFLFATLFLLYHFSSSPDKKRLFFITGTTSAFFALLTIAFAYQNFNNIKTNVHAIVYAQKTEVKTAPTLSSTVSFELHEGTKVQVLENLDNWKKIKLVDGKIGWMVANDLKELK